MKETIKHRVEYILMSVNHLTWFPWGT
jgi:hypothetical protein